MICKVQMNYVLQMIIFTNDIYTNDELPKIILLKIVSTQNFLQMISFRYHTNDKFTKVKILIFMFIAIILKMRLLL